MPDHSFTTPEEVQYIGQTPDEIGQQFDALALREAEATRIALECRVKRAKLHRQSLEQHGFKGKQYVEFVSQHGGASRTDAYDMLLLAEAADDVLAPPDAANDPYYQFPHWRTVWREIKTRHKETENRHWITPPETEAIVREEIGDFHDPFPYPSPDCYDALEVDWLDPSYVNASFVAAHEKKGRGLTAVAYHAIGQVRKNGITVAMVVPVNRIVCQLIEAGATVRSLGRVRWRHTVTGKAMPGPHPCVLFTLRPHAPHAANDLIRRRIHDRRQTVSRSRVCRQRTRKGPMGA